MYSVESQHWLHWALRSWKSARRHQLLSYVSRRDDATLNETSRPLVLVGRWCCVRLGAASGDVGSDPGSRWDLERADPLTAAEPGLYKPGLSRARLFPWLCLPFPSNEMGRVMHPSLAKPSETCRRKDAGIVLSNKGIITNFNSGVLPKSGPLWWVRTAGILPVYWMWWRCSRHAEVDLSFQVS